MIHDPTNSRNYGNDFAHETTLDISSLFLSSFLTLFLISLSLSLSLCLSLFLALLFLSYFFFLSCIRYYFIIYRVFSSFINDCHDTLIMFISLFYISLIRIFMKWLKFDVWLILPIISKNKRSQWSTFFTLAFFVSMIIYLIFFNVNKYKVLNFMNKVGFCLYKLAHLSTDILLNGAINNMNLNIKNTNMTRFFKSPIEHPHITT